MLGNHREILDIVFIKAVCFLNPAQQFRINVFFIFDLKIIKVSVGRHLKHFPHSFTFDRKIRSEVYSYFILHRKDGPEGIASDKMDTTWQRLDFYLSYLFLYL